MTTIEKLECRNCHLLWPTDTLHPVFPGHRFCAKCYGKMVEIGQCVPCPQRRDGTMVLLFEGDPFRLRNRDPFQRMFRPGPQQPLNIPPGVRDT